MLARMETINGPAREALVARWYVIGGVRFYRRSLVKLSADERAALAAAGRAVLRRPVEWPLPDHTPDFARAYTDAGGTDIWGPGPYLKVPSGSSVTTVRRQSTGCSALPAGSGSGGALVHVPPVSGGGAGSAWGGSCPWSRGCLKGERAHHDGVLARSYFAGDIFDRAHYCRPWRRSSCALACMGRSRRFFAWASV